MCSVHISGEEGEEEIIKEGVKDGGRLEKKGGGLHFVFGHVSDWYFDPLVEGRGATISYRMDVHMNYICTCMDEEV